MKEYFKTVNLPANIQDLIPEDVEEVEVEYYYVKGEGTTLGGHPDFRMPEEPDEFELISIGWGERKITSFTPQIECEMYLYLMGEENYE